MAAIGPAAVRAGALSTEHAAAHYTDPRSPTPSAPGSSTSASGAAAPRR